MSIEEQIEQCWQEREAEKSQSDGQENTLNVISGDVSIKPESRFGKRPRPKRSWLKTQRQNAAVSMAG